MSLPQAQSDTPAAQHFRTCHLCEAMCGVVIEHREGRILSIKGDKADPLSRGHICPKAVALQDLHEDPDRLRRPVKRVGRDWVEISWEEAYATIEENVKRVRREHGADAVALYVGNPSAHTPAVLLLPALMLALGGLKTRRFSATSVDQLPAMLASQQMLGHQVLFPVPDLDRCDFLLIVGGNPAASNGSLMSAGDPMGRIKSIRDRGGRVVVLDPRRTETAEKADEHIFIRPGTDFFFLAAMAQEIFAQDRMRLRHLAGMVQGLDELREALREFTPDVVADITGVPAAKIRELAQALVAAPAAACYGRMGSCVQEFGGLTTWMLYVLNILSGNMDREGGVMFTRPPFDIVGLGPKGHYGKEFSRVRGLPDFGGEHSVAVMAEEILTPGKGKIRLLATHAGNPVLSTPNGRQLDEALASLDFMFSIDLYINETTRHADIILPPTSALERSHMDVAIAAVNVRNFAKWSPPLFDAPADSRHDWQILLELSNRLAAGSDTGRGLRRRVQQVMEKFGLDAALDLLVRFGPYGTHRKLAARKSSLRERLGAVFKPDPEGLSLAKLKQHPHGIDLGPLERAFPDWIFTRSGKIEVAPALYVKDVARARMRLAEGEQGGMLLIGRRHLRSNNSWMHNSHRLVKGKPRCTAFLHPQDALRLGIAEGQEVRVGTRVGSIVLPVEITDSIMPGVVSVPHGWGHDREGVRLEIARKVAGVSVNDITDERHIDELTAMPVLNGVPVTVAAVLAAGAKAEPVGLAG